MKPGHRWLAFDADFFFNPFTVQLRDRFGYAGVAVFVAFLCACKRSTIPGTFTYTTDAEALALLGLDGAELVGPDGEKFDLATLWKFTGTRKQTSRTRFGHRWKVTATRWEQWQKSLRTDENALRMAAKRRAQAANELRTNGAQIANTERTENRSRRKGENPPYPPTDDAPAVRRPAPPTTSAGRLPGPPEDDPRDLADLDLTVGKVAIELTKRLMHGEPDA